MMQLLEFYVPQKHDWQRLLAARIGAGVGRILINSPCDARVMLHNDDCFKSFKIEMHTSEDLHDQHHWTNQGKSLLCYLSVPYMTEMLPSVPSAYLTESCPKSQKTAGSAFIKPSSATLEHSQAHVLASFEAHFDLLTVLLIPANGKCWPKTISLYQVYLALLSTVHTLLTPAYYVSRVQIPC